MTYKEIQDLINSRECYLKEIFFTRRQVYEIVNSSNVKLVSITYNQRSKIFSEYKTTLYKEDYNGFTKRLYKIGDKL